MLLIIIGIYVPAIIFSGTCFGIMTWNFLDAMRMLDEMEAYREKARADRELERRRYGHAP